MGLAALTIALTGGAYAAEQEEEKRVVNGPSKTTFGAFDLILGQGASSEVKYQPDAQTLSIKTLVGEARAVTSAQNLILIENLGGRVEVLTPNGKVVGIEPGKSDIVGRAIVNDPGTITIRLSGLGPIAQVGGTPGGPITTSANLVVLGQPYQSSIQPIYNTLLGFTDTVIQTPLSP